MHLPHDQQRASARAETVPLSGPPVTLSCFRGYHKLSLMNCKLLSSLSSLPRSERKANACPRQLVIQHPFVVNLTHSGSAASEPTYRLRVEGSDVRDDGQPTKLTRSPSCPTTVPAGRQGEIAKKFPWRSDPGIQVLSPFGVNWMRLVSPDSGLKKPTART